MKMLKSIAISRIKLLNLLSRCSYVSYARIDQLPSHDFIKDFLSKNPKIKESNIEKFLVEIQNNSLPVEILEPVLQNCPELLNIRSKVLSEHLEGWRQCNFGKDLIELLFKHPSILFLSKSHVEKRYINLSQMFTRNDIFKVILNSPLVLTEPIDETIQKVKYLEDYLKYTKPVIIKSSALNHSYSKIKNRFEFMIRTGAFKVPKPKTLDVDKASNPELSKVLQLNNHDFANQICRVSLLEFNVFQEMVKQSEEEED